MERFLGFVKQIRRSRRRKGKKYRPEEDYHEGYEDVYYYASEHFRKENGFRCSFREDLTAAIYCVKSNYLLQNPGKQICASFGVEGSGDAEVVD
ncbi:hypothetical protein Q9966_002095 [Columba livia]|nr:hypothetical protein Q9966_002095 [Columba livia]